MGYLLALSQPTASAAKDSCTPLNSSFYEFPAVELQVAVNPADSCFSLAAGDANICIPAYTGQVRARICKRLWSPGIDPEESTPPSYVAWRAGTTNRVVIQARQAGNQFMGSLKGLQIRALD